MAKSTARPLAVALIGVAPFAWAATAPAWSIAGACFATTIAGLGLASLGWPAGLASRGLGRVSASPALRGAALASLAALLGVGGLELSARALVALGWVEPYEAMRTLVPGGSEDWRLAHVTADRHREPDPVLLWRPAPRPPYNAQRMKGPLAEIPKPPGRVRIIAYGDSNTDGPADGGWVGRLAAAIGARGGGEVEVLDAGVAGYSSHQGLARFRQQVATFEPDVVLVSFGWNDAVDVASPDRAYAPPAAWRVALIRGALHYRAFRVALRWRADRPAPSAAAKVPRVSLDDYVANLAAFDELARAHGAVPVLLTRPYRPWDAASPPRGWRRQVPRYNRALLDFARQHGVLALDVQSAAGPADFVDECHFDPEGHARLAAWLADALLGAGVVPAGPAGAG